MASASGEQPPVEVGSGLDEPVVATPTPAPAVPDGGGGGATLALSLVLPLVIAAAFFLLFRGRSKSRGDRVVLFGPMGAGKTALSLERVRARRMLRRSRKVAG